MTTLYITKRFTGGLLRGLAHVDAMPFPSVDAAAKWVGAHRTKPVKAIRGSSPYVIEDASFQDYRR